MDRTKLAKTFALDDVVVQGDQITRIGSFHSRKNGSTPGFNVDFLRSFCSANGIVLGSKKTKTDILKHIVEVKKRSAEGGGIGELTNAVEALDLNAEKMHTHSRVSMESLNLNISSASLLDLSDAENGQKRIVEPSPMYANHAPAHKEGRPIQNQIEIELRKLEVEEKKLEMEEKKLEVEKRKLIMEYNECIDKTQTKIKRMCAKKSSTELEEEMKNEAFVVLNYYWNERNKLMREK